MLRVEFRTTVSGRKWAFFGTTNNPVYAMELAEACRRQHPGCECRTREAVCPPHALRRFPAAGSAVPFAPV